MVSLERASGVGVKDGAGRPVLAYFLLFVGSFVFSLGLGVGSFIIESGVLNLSVWPMYFRRALVFFSLLGIFFVLRLV